MKKLSRQQLASVKCISFLQATDITYNFGCNMFLEFFNGDLRKETEQITSTEKFAYKFFNTESVPEKMRDHFRQSLGVDPSDNNNYIFNAVKP